MTHDRAFLSLALLVLFGCGGTAEEDVTTAEVTINANTTGGERAAPHTAAGTVIEGMAGGPVEASRMHPECAGWLPSAPQYLMEVSTPEDLAITATTMGDAVLAVVMRDGTILCNDDAVGLNPRVAGHFEPGTYPVFVGTYGTDETGIPFRLTVDIAVRGAPLGMSPSTHIAGVPTACGMTVPTAGPIYPGSLVVLGAHSPYTGPDGRGGVTTDDTWWNDEMWGFVGMTATVTEVGVDPVGCPYVRVDVDGGSWGWRVRDLGPPGGPMAPFYGPEEFVVGEAPLPPARPTPPFTGVGIAGVPSQCGMTIPDYGPLRVGMPIVLGAHTAWSGPDGRGEWVAADTWWNEDMWAHVGSPAIITELGGLDPVGCPYVRVDIDGGTWGWRIRDLRPR